MATILEQYRISDFLEWHSQRRLVLNPDFQRGSVWTQAARAYLIDTILRQLPMPKIYLRTRVDLTTMQSVREVVDGQQRLRAIIEFAGDRFALGRRSGEWAGKHYSSLEPELQERFISYPIAVGQLLNASDEDVLEVFARLNSYNVTLNPAEKRHAEFQGEFKWTVRRMSGEWAVLWEKYHVISVRQRVRMLDDSLMAELFGVVLRGVTDGGEPKIRQLYREIDSDFSPEDSSIAVVNDVLEYIVSTLAEDLEGTPVLSRPHFLMLFAAVAHARHGIPDGEMGSAMPVRSDAALRDVYAAREQLLELAAVIDSEGPVPGHEPFWNASKASTQRIATRRVRFPVFYKALLPRR